jgi:hypothetical protein
LKHDLPLLALVLCARSSTRGRPQSLAAVAEQRLCPRPAQPPAQLVVPPKKMDFISPIASWQPSRRSSSTN